MNGLGRILASETNVSDLLAYFTDEDPSPWGELIGTVPVAVVREGRASTAKRADLLLKDESSATVGAVEVKLGHHLSKEQSDWYTATFDADAPLLLASLDPVDERIALPDARWSAVLLPDLMGRWTNSPVREVAVLATSVTEILTAWSTQVAAVSAGIGGSAAEPLATISDPFLARVLTRALEPAILEAGAESSYAGVTSGGGNAILQSWRRFSDRPKEQKAIAEVRWKPATQVMDLRFGVDVRDSGREAREAAWQLAKALDEAIRADNFAAHLREVDPNRAELLVASRRAGRPSAKGDWEEIVKKGFERGDAKRYNPGFHRDGDTRFEATVRVDTTRATGPDIVALLERALTYLTERV